MTWIDDLTTELQKSPKISPETLSQITTFLQQHQDLINALASDARNAFFTALAGGSPADAFAALTDTLTSPQLLTLLKDTAGEILDLSTLRQKALVQFQSTLSGIESFALQLLAKAALALL